jgi:glutamate dehydrogenase
MNPELERYFPAPLPERFGPRLRTHRLRREIIATRVTNDVVDRAGATFVARLQEDTGARASDIARAHAVARDVFGLRGLWHDVEALDLRVPAATQTAMLLDARRLAERATRWLLRARSRPLDIAAEVARFRPGAEAVAAALPGALVLGDRARWDERVARLVADDVPEAVAARVAGVDALFPVLDIVEVADATGIPVQEVAALHFTVGERLALHWLRDRVAALPRADRWEAMARAALRDDLFSLHAELTADVLRDTPAPAADADGDAPATSVTDAAGRRLDTWLAGHEAAVQRCLSVLGDVRAGGTFDLATLPVALREVRNLIQATRRAAA